MKDDSQYKETFDKLIETNEDIDPIKNIVSKKSNKNMQKLLTILNIMSIEFPLNNLSEKIESETGGKFTFKQLYRIINNYYKKITKKDKKNLIRYIFLSHLNITYDRPYISLYSLFDYFGHILNSKIYSPSLTVYEISNKIIKIYKKSTLEFFISNKLQASGEINLEDLINLFYRKLNINELITVIFFKILDYNKKNKIKIEDIILVIDSFRDDNFNNILNENDKYMLLLCVILDKNFINIDKLFTETKNEYISCDTLRTILTKYINKSNQYCDLKEIFNEILIDNIIITLSKDEKIYKEDIKKYFLEVQSKLKNKKIELNITQKFWINKYIDLLSSISVTPQMEFKSLLEDNNSQKNSYNAIELDDLKNKLIKDISLGKINLNDLHNIIKSFDVNFNGIIVYWQYEECINQVLKDKETIMNLECPNYHNENNNDISNMWVYGVRPYNYYILPYKGNYNVLSKLNKNIGEIISNYNQKEKKEVKIQKTLDTYKTIGSMSSDLTYFKKGLNIMNNEEFNDEYFLKSALENFNFNKNYFACFDLINYLIEKEDFSNKFSYDVVRYLDNDDDGYINIVDVIKFLLHALKYRATKLVYKYLYIKIYKELNLSSSKEFFNNYNFKISDVIDIQKLKNFFIELNIEFPLTKQIINELEVLYNPPLIYEYICDLIDSYKNDSYINNLFYEKKEKKNININSKTFEQEIKNNVNYLIDKENNNDTTDNKLRKQLNKILENCDDIMNYSEYNKKFAEPLNLNDFFSLTLFQLLKTISNKGEQQISKYDLLMFFESYSFENEKLKTPTKKKDIKELINKIEELGAPLNYSLEIIPFRRNGIIPSSELIKYLNDFYNGSILKNDLITIVFFIDTKKIDIINYEQLQLFLNKYCNIFSFKLELQIIVCNLCKDNYFNAESYFDRNKFRDIIGNKNIINKKQHNILLKDICSNDKNKMQLFNYLAKNGKNYDLEYLFNLLNMYFELDPKQTNGHLLVNNSKILESDDDVNEDVLPNKSIIEQVLKNINLGEKGIFSINEFIMKFKRKYRKKLLEKIDKKKKGFITFPEFIKNCIEIYGTNIDLNYKLCAQYLYKKYIKEPNNIQKFLLDKTKESFIQSYLTYEKCYSNFMFAFCNNKILFESFYLIYKEKKGKHAGMINLQSIEQFIYVNNKHLINIEVNKSSRSIKDILHKKMIKIKDIINHINIIQSGLEKNFLIKENYLRSILQTKLNFIDKDINIICSLFKAEEDKFDLKKFFLYENEDLKKYNIILYDEILPKIKNKIKRSEYNSYKEYKLKIFNNIDYLDICELYSKFNNLYDISLYNCLLLMGNEQFFSTEKFFNDNNLKNEFRNKDYDPTLKLALTRLNDFFQKNNDKIKIFKEFDLDRNGKLSSDEFITALNSFEDLNLNDNQKYKILNIIDINKDGRIDIQEFIKFVNSIKNNINENGELTASIPLIKKKINLKENNIEQNNINDKNQIKNNLSYNKNILKQNNNDFLNYIIILQEDLLKNDNECISKEFSLEDPMEKGIISINKFKNILKKKLFNIKGGNIDKFINLANMGLKEDDNKENDTKKINYNNFLKNLSDYRYDKKGNTSHINYLPKIN